LLKYVAPAVSGLVNQRGLRRGGGRGGHRHRQLGDSAVTAAFEATALGTGIGNVKAGFRRIVGEIAARCKDHGLRIVDPEFRNIPVSDDQAGRRHLIEPLSGRAQNMQMTGSGVERDTLKVFQAAVPQGYFRNRRGFEAERRMRFDPKDSRPDRIENEQRSGLRIDGHANRIEKTEVSSVHPPERPGTGDAITAGIHLDELARVGPINEQSIPDLIESHIDGVRYGGGQAQGSGGVSRMAECDHVRGAGPRATRRRHDEKSIGPGRIGQAGGIRMAEPADFDRSNRPDGIGWQGGRQRLRGKRVSENDRPTRHTAFAGDDGDHLWNSEAVAIPAPASRPERPTDVSCAIAAGQAPM
jgi:hypothetical protein